jgi:hypothetical protein
MELPDAGRVLQLLRAGVVRVGAVDAPFGARVTVGGGEAVVVRVGPEETGLALISGAARVGDVVTDARPLTLPTEPRFGRVLSPFGVAQDGGAAYDGPRARWRAPSLSMSASSSSAWVRTGLRSVDLLDPLTTGGSRLWTGAGTGLLELVCAFVSGEVLVAMPGAPRSEVQRVRRAAPSAAILWTGPEAPPLAVVQTLRAAVLAAPKARVTLVHGLGRAAAAARALSVPLSTGRDPFGWPLSFDAEVAAVGDAAGEGRVVLGTAVLDAPGLEDHLVPWFDAHTRFDAAPLGRLPRVHCGDAPSSKLGPAPLPRDLRRDAGVLRARLGAASREADVASLFGRPAPTEAAWRVLDQRPHEAAGDLGALARQATAALYADGA